MCYSCCRLLLLFVFFYDYFSLSLSFLLSLVLCLSLTSSIPSSLSRSLSFSHILCLTHALFLTLFSYHCYVFFLQMHLFCLISPGVSFSFSLSPSFSCYIYHSCFHSPFVFDLMKSAKLETLSPSLVCRLCGVMSLVLFS